MIFVWSVLIVEDDLVVFGWIGIVVVVFDNDDCMVFIFVGWVIVFGFIICIGIL